MFVSFCLFPPIVHFGQFYNGNFKRVIGIYSYRSHYSLFAHLRANHRQINLYPRPSPAIIHNLGQNRFGLLRYIFRNIRRIKHKGE